MIEFFLRRPHFAGVLSFVVLLAGLVTIPTLPIAQYPQISPPTVTVTSQYPGASAAMVMRSVTTPLEININGADGLQYMQSYSSANGTSVSSRVPSRSERILPSIRPTSSMASI